MIHRRLLFLAICVAFSVRLPASEKLGNTPQSAAVSASAQWPLPVTDATSAGISPVRLDALHRNVQQLIDDEKFSGYVSLLARDGKIVDCRAYGWQNIASKTSMRADSIVRIFSMSKLITTTAVLMLMEDGRLNLGDPVEKFLPALKNRKVFVGGTAEAPLLVDAKRPITIHDLLTHTAGYYYWESWTADAPLVELMQRAKLPDAPNLDEFVTRAALVPLHDQPGTRFRYGISTDLLGAVVEKISGLRLDQFFKQRIFVPLDLRDTGFWVAPEKHGRLATIYRRDETNRLIVDAKTNEERVGPDHGLLSGGSGLYSTAADYARFAQMLLNGGQLNGVRLLSHKTVDLMTRDALGPLASPHPNGVASQGFGLGVRVVTDLGAGTTLGSAKSFGWDGAVTTNVQMDPKERLVIIILLQHLPFNQDDIFATFTNGFYSALEN